MLYTYVKNFYIFTIYTLVNFARYAIVTYKKIGMNSFYRYLTYVYSLRIIKYSEILYALESVQIYAHTYVN